MYCIYFYLLVRTLLAHLFDSIAASTAARSLGEAICRESNSRRRSSRLFGGDIWGKFMFCSSGFSEWNQPSLSGWLLTLLTCFQNWRMKTRTCYFYCRSCSRTGSAYRGNLALLEDMNRLFATNKNVTKYANANEQKAKYERWSALVPYCQDCGF